MDELFAEGALRVVWEPPPGVARVVRDAPDVSALPGARVVGLASYGDAATIALAGCVRGPSERFVAGLEGVLFDKATWFVLRAADAQPLELAVTATGGSVADGYVFEDRVGKVRDGALTVRSALTFVGDERDVLLCSAACVTRGDAPCAASTATLHVEGQHAPPPDPALWMRAIFFTAEHPLEVGAVVALACLIAAVVIVRRRARSRSGPAALLALLCVGGCASQAPTDVSGPVASTTAIHATPAPSSGVRRNARATCAEGAPCVGDEVCCRVRGTPPSTAICAPSARASPTGEADERADLVAACAAALPGPDDSAGPIRSWIALACSDSSDCGADRLCVLDDPDRASAVRSLTGTCVPYAEPLGLEELCSRGTCRLPNSVCAAAEPDAPRVCVSAAGPRCGDTTCKPGDACDASEAKCVHPKPIEELQFVYRCTQDSECPGGLECCVGPQRSECNAGCDFSFFFPTCDGDFACPVTAPWTEMHCAAVPDAPAPTRACSPYP